MASLGLTALLALLLLVRCVLSCEAILDDLSQHRRPEGGGGGGAGGGGDAVLVLPSSSYGEGGGGKSGAGESGKVGSASGSGSRSSTTTRSSSSSSSSSSSAGARSIEATETGGALYNESKEAVSCPASCFRANPVCGEDGVTYWCGSADAECAGVEVEYVGFCDFGSRGTGGKGVLAVQSLLLVHMIWLMLAACLVLLGVP